MSPKDLQNQKLNYGQNQISFQFKEIKYPVSRNIRYRYRVNNGAWINNGEVLLQSLRAESYNIYMEGFNPEDQDVVTKKISFVVNPPFWKSIWFIIVSLLIIASLFWFLMKYRIKRLNSQHEEKTKLILRNAELQLRSLQIQMNPHFIFNTLNAIQTFIINQDVEESLKYIGKLSGIIRTNLENATEEYISLSKEVEFLTKYIDIE